MKKGSGAGKAKRKKDGVAAPAPASQNATQQSTNAESGPEDTGIRKVAKTMIFEVTGAPGRNTAIVSPTDEEQPAAAAVSPGIADQSAVAAAIGPSGDEQSAIASVAGPRGNEQSAVASVVGPRGDEQSAVASVVGPGGSDQSAAAEIGESVGEPEKPKRKVPKTLLFDTASVVEAAALKAAAESQKAPPTPLPTADLSGNEEQSGLEETVTVIEAAKAVTETEESVGEPEKPQRKVPKTLLFDIASVVEAAALKAAAESQKASPSPSLTANLRGNDEQSGLEETVAVIEAAKEAQPEVTTSTSGELAEGQKPKRKVPKTLLFDTAAVVAAAAAAAHEQEVAAKAALEKVAPSLISAVKTEAAPQPNIDASQIGEIIDASPTDKIVDSSPANTIIDASPADKIIDASAANTIIDASPTDKIVDSSPTDQIIDKSQHANADWPPAPTFDDAPPELNIDSPPVLLFFEDQQTDLNPDKRPAPGSEKIVQEPLAKKPTGPSFDDAPPELNIDSPPVLLFFEDPPPDLDIITAAAPQAAMTEATGPAQTVSEQTPAATDSQTAAPPTTAPMAATPNSLAGAPDATETAQPEKPKRRVPKTLLFNPVIGADGIEVDRDRTSGAPATAPPSTPAGAQAQQSGTTAVGSEQNFEPDARGPRRISTKKIAKTLLFNSPVVLEQSGPDTGAGRGTDAHSGTTAATDADAHSTPAQGEQATTEAPLNPVEAEKVVERYIARTMLDHSILFDQLSKTQQKIEAKAIETAKEKANEPFKPFFPIECKKMALPCTWTWDESNSSEKYRYCGKCQRPVYNFTGLEIADAEEIILKAENRQKFTLYKRTDGKFMTGDCPLAVKKRNDLILVSTGCILLACVLVVYMMTLPKPKPQPVAAAATTVHKKHHASIPTVKTAAGSGHYEAGKGFVMTAPAPAPVQAAPVPTVTAPDSDENGQNWEYSAPQTGGQQIIDPQTPAPVAVPTVQQPGQQQPCSQQQLQQQPISQQQFQQQPAQLANPTQQPGSQPGQPAQSPYVKTYR